MILEHLLTRDHFEAYTKDAATLKHLLEVYANQFLPSVSPRSILADEVRQFSDHARGVLVTWDSQLLREVW